MSPTFEDGAHKARYASRRLAVTVLNHRMQGRIRGSHRKQRHGRPEFLRVYHCPDCNGWHLTRKAGRQ